MPRSERIDGEALVAQRVVSSPSRDDAAVLVAEFGLLIPIFVRFGISVGFPIGTAGVTDRAADRGNGFAEFFAYLDLARRRFHVDQDALVRRGAEAEFTVNEDVNDVKARATNVELKLDCHAVLRRQDARRGGKECASTV